MDTTKLKGFWQKVKDFFKNMTMKVRVLLAVAVVLVVAVIAALLLWSSNEPYEMLFTDLSATESSEIIGYLEESGYNNYRLEGDTIYVRAEQRDLITARLAMVGYPKNGSLYDTWFENVGAMTTSSQAAKTWIISVQERLEATIRTFDEVRSATVNLNLGEERTYVFENEPAVSSATVVVELSSGDMLSDKTATSIRNVVAHAIQGMTIENISLSDTKGNPYGLDAGGLDELTDASQLKLQREQYYNNLIRTNIMQILEGIYGQNNVRVSVNTTIDINRRYIENTTYSQPEGSYENGGLIGREEWLYYIGRDGENPVGGVVGTESNSDLSTYVSDALQADGSENIAGQSGNRDNKIDESHEQIEVVAGTITDVTVAVTINRNAPTASEVDEDNLRYHVAVAAGIGGTEEEYAGRVSVLVAPFAEDTASGDIVTPWLTITPDMLPFIIIGGIALLVLIVVLILILRGRRKKKAQRQAEEQARAEAEAAAAEAAAAAAELQAIGMELKPGEEPPMTGANINDVDIEKSLELRKTVRQFAQNNPEIAAQLLKNWLRGEDGNGK